MTSLAMGVGTDGYVLIAAGCRCSLVLNAQRSTLNAQRSTLNAQRSTLNAQRIVLNLPFPEYGRVKLPIGVPTVISPLTVYWTLPV